MPHRERPLWTHDHRRPAPDCVSQRLVAAIPELHRMSRADPRLQRRQLLHPVAMRPIHITITILSLAAVSALPSKAQPTVAPTNEPVGTTRGDNASGYNIRQSWELGYRYHTV